jgi:chorismate mutase
MVQGEQLSPQRLRHVALADATKPLVVAGPCSAENRDQVLTTARALAAMGGVTFYRAGLWKPRTRPNSFEGLGQEALAWLAEAQQATGLRAITEVATPEHVEAILKSGLTAVWIGARTTASPFAVQALADAMRGTHLTVLVKNPMHADLKLWIGAIERIIQSVGDDVGALHRGFSSYGSAEFRNAPMWEIPIALRAELPDIPLLCDPSHIAGKSHLVQDVAQRAMNLGMEGLMIECHPCPAEALSDAEQQVTPDQLLVILQSLDIPTSGIGGHEDRNTLEELRMQIDSVDEQLLQLLSKRMDLARTIGHLKHKNRWSLLSVARWRDIMASREHWGQQLGLNQGFLGRILASVHEESIRVQGDEADKRRASRKK